MRVGVKDAVVSRLRRVGCTDDEVCAVCQETGRGGGGRVLLPCGHKFCEGCVVPWLRENKTCPSCRWEFPDRDVEVKGRGRAA